MRFADMPPDLGALSFPLDPGATSGGLEQLPAEADYRNAPSPVAQNSVRPSDDAFSGKRNNFDCLPNAIEIFRRVSKYDVSLPHRMRHHRIRPGRHPDSSYGTCSFSNLKSGLNLVLDVGRSECS